MHHPSTRFCPFLVHTQKVLASASTSILAERRKEGKKDDGGREEEKRTNGWREGQRAKKVVSNSPGLVKFPSGIVNSVLNLPNG